MREVLDRRSIVLGAAASNRDDAIRQCGQLLVDVGAVAPAYVEAMLERERSITTYVGAGFAIPHGTNAAKEVVQRDAISFLGLPDGVDWGGEKVLVCVGIAAVGRGHLKLLAALAEILLDPDRAETLRSATDIEAVLKELQ